MTFTIAFGWWLIPFSVTLAAFAWHSWVHWGEQSSGGYGAIGYAFGWAVTVAAALIVSLVAWLIYFIAV